MRMRRAGGAWAAAPGLRAGREYPAQPAAYFTDMVPVIPSAAWGSQWK
jgi:hypothetical protein